MRPLSVTATLLLPRYSRLEGDRSKAASKRRKLSFHPSKQTCPRTSESNNQKKKQLLRLKQTRPIHFRPCCRRCCLDFACLGRIDRRAAPKRRKLSFNASKQTRPSTSESNNEQQEQPPRRRRRLISTRAAPHCGEKG